MRRGTPSCRSAAATPGHRSSMSATSRAARAHRRCGPRVSEDHRRKRSGGSSGPPPRRGSSAPTPVGGRSSGSSRRREAPAWRPGWRSRRACAALASGGVTGVLPGAGWTLDGGIGLRTVEAADRSRDLATPGSHAVIVGAGFIGCEVAASLRYLGVEVDGVEFFELPLIRVVGPEVARVYAELHAEHGVGLHMRQGAERFEGDDRVRAVLTTDGARLPCDFVVTGVGIAPVTELAQG